MTTYGEIVNALTEPSVGFWEAQVGTEGDTICQALLIAGVVWEAQGGDTSRVFYRENRKTVRSARGEVTSEGCTYVYLQA